jgi:hypothetical protein
MNVNSPERMMSSEDNKTTRSVRGASWHLESTVIFEFLSTLNIKTEGLILDSILRRTHLSDTYELPFQRLMQVIQKVLRICYRRRAAHASMSQSLRKELNMPATGTRGFNSSALNGLDIVQQNDELPHTLTGCN